MDLAYISSCTKHLNPNPKFNFSSDYLNMAIELGMRSAKKKPMTKKEREEKRRKRKEKRLKK
jgi:hypothetical protein